jgi:hypothetical protein
MVHWNDPGSAIPNLGNNFFLIHSEMKRFTYTSSVRLNVFLKYVHWFSQSQ